MSEDERRLLNCFSSVFPGLSNEEICKANADVYSPWDSLTSVTLVAVVEEEFNIEIESEFLPNLNSYESFREYVLYRRSRA
jgi:acyl carrier protein